MTTEKENRNLILRVIEYGKENDVFTLEELFKGIGLTKKEEENYIYNHLLFSNGQNNPNHIIQTMVLFGYAKKLDSILSEPCRILPTALFSYIDHEEIIEARKAAKSARVLSWIAIIISLLTGVGSLIIGYFQLQMSFNNL